MSRRGSVLAAVAAVALGFALIAWVTTADSVQMLRAPTGAGSAAGPPTADQRQTPFTGAATQTPGVKATGTHGPDLSWIGVLLAVLLLLVATAALVLLARWAWRNRWHRAIQPAPVAFEVLPEVALAALIADAPAQFATLEEGSPRNAIVACWLRLEDAVGQAGFPRHPAETSTEFTTRILAELAVDPAMLNGFARFYREARFSEHKLGERARRAAIAALRSLYDDIDASGTSIPEDLLTEEAP